MSDKQTDRKFFPGVYLFKGGIEKQQPVISFDGEQWWLPGWECGMTPSDEGYGGAFSVDVNDIGELIWPDDRQNRENWLKGRDPSDGTLFNLGEISCVGCGRDLGTTCWIPDTDEHGNMVDNSLPMPSSYPFNQATCPVCREMREIIPDKPETPKSVAEAYKLGRERGFLAGLKASSETELD